MAKKKNRPTVASILRTKALERSYGKKKVVKGVDIFLHRGEVVGLLGPNGAGKTTSFYMMVGLISPSSGKVFLNNIDITAYPMHKRARLGIGYLPQDPSILSRLTVEGNIRAIAEILPIGTKERKALIEHHLKELNLKHLAYQRAYTLSGGERRRLEITRALVTKPHFLLMDEPFSGVDPINVSEVQEIIVSLKSKGIGVLITDHNVRETLRIVDRAYVLHDGEVLFEGERHFLAEDPRCREFYLGENFNL